MECNRSVTWGEVVDLAGMVPKLYQVRVDVLCNICCSRILACKNYSISVDPIERWHYKVFPLSPPDLQNPLRLNGLIRY